MMAMNTFAQTIAYTHGIQKKSTKNYANKMQHTGHIGGMANEQKHPTERKAMLHNRQHL